MARLVGLATSRLAVIEAGEAAPTVEEVTRFARVLGVRPGDLARGVAGQAPLPMLLRSVHDDQREALHALIETRAIDTLGAFQQRVLDVADLEMKLGHERNALPRTFTFVDPEREARTMRLRWSLGAEAPIASMRALLRRLDVGVFYVGGETLTGEIDGACTDWPRPAILVNLTRPEAWWRTCMTLAHELAHLLFHMGTQRSLYSPRAPRGEPRRAQAWRWESFEGFDAVESQANAFAACFLAPAEGVRAVVDGLDPSTEEAIARVGSRFGVGRTVAINRLQIAFGLSDAQRQAMALREMWALWETCFDDDRVHVDEVGIDRGPLPKLVAEALRRGCLGRVRAEEILGVSVDLDPTRSGAQRQAERVRQRALRYLAQQHPAVEYVVDRVVPEGDGWRAVVVRGEAGTRETPACGSLLLDAQGAVLHDAVAAPG